MTALTTTRKISFTGDGSTTAFPTGFIFFEDTDIEVIERTIATGVEVIKVLTTDYTVSGGDPINGAVGTINAVIAPPATVEWIIRRVLPRTQEHDLPVAGPLPSELVENADDRAVLLIQEVEEAGSRALTFPATDPASISSIIPNSIDRADKVQAYDSAGMPIVSTLTLAEIEGGSTDAAASAAAAAVSEGNAAGSAAAAAADAISTANDVVSTNADVVLAEAAASAAAIAFNFDSSIVLADPGTADLRFDNATVSSVTNLAVSANTGETGNPDMGAFIATWDDSTNLALRGTIVIRKDGEPATFAVFSVTAAITDNTTWLQIPVTFVDGFGTFSDTDALHIQFARTGNAGSGAGGGLYKGDNGTVGNNAGDIFRINEAELNTNTTIETIENSSCTGPLTIAAGVTLTVKGVLVII